MKRRYNDDDDDDEDYSDYYGYSDDYGDEDACLEDYTTPPEAIRVAGPIHAVNRRGEFGTTWWGKEWLTALKRVGMDSRLDRGRTYARNGSVLFMEISHGMAYARIQGTVKYCTYVRLKVFSPKEWEKALAALSSQAIYAAKLLAGEMPADIETVFQQAGLSLFPRDDKDIKFECSCPDGYSNPCKHAAALYYLLAEQLDADPFRLFHLRGRTRDKVLATLRNRRSGNATPVQEYPPIDADLGAFWNGGIVNLAAPTIPDQPPLLRELGDPPGDVGNTLRTIYHSVSLSMQDQIAAATDQDADQESDRR